MIENVIREIMEEDDDGAPGDGPSASNADADADADAGHAALAAVNGGVGGAGGGASAAAALLPAQHLSGADLLVPRRSIYLQAQHSEHATAGSKRRRGGGSPCEVAEGAAAGVVSGTRPGGSLGGCSPERQRKVAKGRAGDVAQRQQQQHQQQQQCPDPNAAAAAGGEGDSEATVSEDGKNGARWVAPFSAAGVGVQRRCGHELVVVIGT